MVWLCLQKYGRHNYRALEVAEHQRAGASGSAWRVSFNSHKHGSKTWEELQQNAQLLILGVAFERVGDALAAMEVRPDQLGQCSLCREKLLLGIHLPPGRACPGHRLAGRTKKGVIWLYWALETRDLPRRGKWLFPPGGGPCQKATLRQLMELGRGQLACGMGFALLAGAFTTALQRGLLPDWAAQLDTVCAGLSEQQAPALLCEQEPAEGIRHLEV
jgi:hypothetical protein